MKSSLGFDSVRKFITIPTIDNANIEKKLLKFIKLMYEYNKC